MSARRLAATLWEINGLKSPCSAKEKNENFQKEDRKRIEKSGEQFEANLRHTHLLNQSHSPVCKNKDGSRFSGHHRRKSSTNSQKLQLAEYLGAEEMDSVINGAFEVTTTATIKTRLKDVSNSLAGSKEIIRALFRLLSQEQGHNSSKITLASALRVEIDRARHEVDRLINEELYNEKDNKTLLKRFTAEKVAWKRREQDKVVEAISSVSRELEIEKKLRRQSDRLSKRLAKELADKKDELSKAKKKLECEKRAREILEQTYDELKTEEVEIEEKNVALERLRSDLEVYLGGKHGFDDKSSNLERNHEYGEEDTEESELNSIELSMDSLSKSYTWSFAKDESMKNSVDEVFIGRRSLSEKIQWENICLQREKTSDCLETEWNNNNNNNNRKLGNVNGFDKGRLAEVCAQDERNDHNEGK